MDCGAFRGIYEYWLGTDPIDLAGVSITFTPDAADPSGYTFAVVDGLAAFPVTPGTGTTPTALTLGDDSSEEYVFAELASFDFYDVTYTSIFVGSNGQLSFDVGLTDLSATPDELFEHPTIAPFWTELNPSDSDSLGIFVDDFADRLVVTYQVTRWRGDENNEFQAILNSDGTIEIHVLTIAPQVASRNNLVGIASGRGIDPIPAMVNFY